MNGTNIALEYIKPYLHSTMKDSLIISGKSDTPSIHFNIAQNRFEITGRSLPEDATEFYTPVLKWVKQYVQQPVHDITFDFKLEYYNSASARKIVEIIMALNEIVKKNKEVKFNWYYETDDDMMRDAGEELSILSQAPIQLIEVEHL